MQTKREREEDEEERAGESGATKNKQQQQQLKRQKAEKNTHRSSSSSRRRRNSTTCNRSKKRKTWRRRWKPCDAHVVEGEAQLEAEETWRTAALGDIMIAMAEAAAATTATAQNQKKRRKKQKHTSLSLPSLTRPFTHVPKCIHIWIRTSIGGSKFKPESGGYYKLCPLEPPPGIIQGIRSENHGYKIQTDICFWSITVVVKKIKCPDDTLHDRSSRIV